MDESWDADFDGDLKVPRAVRESSSSVKSETQAAKDLAAVTRRLRALLLSTEARAPQPLASVDARLLVRAVAIVHASVTSSFDELYTSDVWAACNTQNLEIAGDSIEDVLREAQHVYHGLQRQLGRQPVLKSELGSN